MTDLLEGDKPFYKFVQRLLVRRLVCNVLYITKIVLKVHVDLTT